MLERWRATAFLIAALWFALSVSITAFDIVVGAEQVRLQLGQATVGAGWMAGLVGLLGLYPRLVDRQRSLVRVGLVFTVVGLVGYAIMTVGVLAIFAGVPEGDVQPLQPVFLPLMLAGSVLTSPVFGLAILRSDARSRLVGMLLVAQTLVFIANALTPTPATVVFVVLLGLLLINVSVGHLLRTGRGVTNYTDAGGSRDPSAS